jgi:hypothetical protein
VRGNSSGSRTPFGAKRAPHPNPLSAGGAREFVRGSAIRLRLLAHLRNEVTERLGNTMSDNRNPTIPAGIFSANDIRRRMAEIEAAKAGEELRRRQAQDEKQKAVMAEFQQPPARTAEQLLPLVMQLVSQAAERGQSEVQIYRFPNTMCTDHGRRINNQEADWPQTLDGRPKAGYEFWRDHLRPLGFGLKAEILEFPGGMPGDVGFFLTWK